MTLWAVPGYTTVRELVRDEAGHVVLARDDECGAPVAIRYLPASAEAATWQPTVAARLADVDDPHLAAPRECVASDHGVAIVRDLVDGVALRALLLEEGALAPEAALVVLADVLRGMAAAHDRDVAHRDCRPGTVLVTRDGGAVLVDVGIASSGHQEPMADGSPFYLAPEQWAGAEAGPRSDIYAAAATFFECVAGAPPYFATDPTRLRDRHENAPLPLDALPGPLREITGRGLAKRSVDRPATATGFLAEVEATAVRGFGEQWDSRGRAELARLAAAPQVPFPLDAATVAHVEAPVAARRAGAVRLGRTVTVTAVMAAFAVGLVNVFPSGSTTDARGNPSEYVRAVPRAVAPDSPASGRAAAPAPGPVAARADQPLAAGPARSASPAAPGEGTAGGTDFPASSDLSGSAPTVPIEIDIGASAPDAADATLRSAPPGADITALSIDSFREQGTATRLAVNVDTTGSEPVELFISYGSGRQADPGSTVMHTTTKRLSGHTSYAVVDERALGSECLDYWTVFVSSEPAAGGTRDNAELYGAPCAVDG